MSASSKISTILPQPQHDQAFQLTLFQETDSRFANTVGLYDSAPRHVLYTHKDARIADTFLKMVERDFIYKGKHYHCALKPARIKRDGAEVEEYPGEREQLIEAVIRKIASQRGHLEQVGQNEFALTFTIYDIKEELRRTRHEFNNASIKEALQILRHAEIEISQVSEKDGRELKSVFASSLFSELAYREHLVREGSVECHVRFNSYVSKAVATLEFQRFDHDYYMSLRDGIARWLYMRLYHEVSFTDEPVLVISAMEINASCGMSQYSRVRDAIRRITKGVEYLGNQFVVTRIDKQPIFERGTRQRIADCEYTIHVSPDFHKQVRDAIADQTQKKRDFKVITGEEPKTLVRLTSEQTARYRRSRALRSLSKMHKEDAEP